MRFPGRVHRRLAPAAAAAAILTTIAGARADDKQRCASAYEQAQAYQKSGKLKAAREQLVQCAQAACPAVIREDCARTLPDLEAGLPTVVIEALDPDGAQTAGVRVLVDGTPLTERLDGRAVPVDPGSHTFRYEMEGAEPIEQQLLVLEGDKRRRLQVRFTRPGAKAEVAGPPEPPAPPAEGERPYGVAPWLTVGLGVASAGAGAVMLVLGSGDVSDAEERCPARACADQSAVDEGNQGRALITTGLVMVILGSAGTVGGLVWQLALNGPKPAGSAAVQPLIGPRFAGLAAHASF